MTFKEACEYLKDDIQSDGSLYNLSNYMCWNKGDMNATLDGVFDVEDLEAIMVYMKGISETPSHT